MANFVSSARLIKPTRVKNPYSWPEEYNTLVTLGFGEGVYTYLHVGDFKRMPLNIDQPDITEEGIFIVKNRRGITFPTRDWSLAAKKGHARMYKYPLYVLDFISGNKLDVVAWLQRHIHVGAVGRFYCVQWFFETGLHHINEYSFTSTSRWWSKRKVCAYARPGKQWSKIPVPISE